MVTRGIVAIGFLAALLAPCGAGEITDLARQAETQASAGRHVEAIETLRRAIDVLSAQAPLSLRHAQYVAQPPKGFGVYQPRATAVFKPGEPLIVYAEPIGMGWKPVDGVNRAQIVTDFEIRTPDGRILGGQRDFGRFDFVSHDRNNEVMTHLTITLSGAPPGKYVFAATFHDKITGKSADMELPFEIR